MEWFLYAIAAAVVTSITAVTEKKLLQHEHALSFSAGHALVVLLLSLPLLLFVDFSVVTLSSLVIMYAGMACAAIAFYLTAKGIKHLELSVSSPLMVANLVFLPFLAFFLLGERLSLQQTTGLLLIFTGVLALELIVHSKKFAMFSMKGKEKYFSLLFVAGFLYALTAIVDKHILSSWSPFTYLFLAHVFIAFNSLILFAILDRDFKRDLKQLFSQDLKTMLLVSLLSLIHRLLLSFAVAGTFVSLAVAVKKLSALFSTILAGRLFHEEKIAEKIVVSIIMLIGAALLVSS